MDQSTLKQPVRQWLSWFSLTGLSLVTVFLVQHSLVVNQLQVDEASFQAASLQSRQERSTPDLVRGPEITESKYAIIKYKDATEAPKGVSMAAEQVNIEKAEGLKKAFTLKEAGAVVYEVEKGNTASEIVERIKAKKKNLIEYAEVDAMTTIAGVVSNDEQYTNGSMWGMYGDSSAPSNVYGTQAAEVWSTGKTGSANVVVGIIDTGVDYVHPDLYLNIWLNQGEIPTALRASLVDVDGNGYINFRDLNNATNASRVRDVNANGRIDGGDLLNDTAWENGLDEDGNGLRDDLIGWDFYNGDNDPMDDNFHGTHVAGTVGAVGGNSIGVTGVVWNAQLMPLKYAGAAGGGFTSRGAQSMDYFVSQSKAPVHSGQKFVATNNSWGTDTFSYTLQLAIERAAVANVLTVASAGNRSRDTDVTPQYPADHSTLASVGYEGVVSVGSVNNVGGMSWFSNFGVKSVDLLAPGEGIVSTTLGGGYGGLSGTSMASPHVAGVLALYASVNPTATGRQIIDKLMSSVVPTAAAAGRTVTGGRVDVEKMIPSVVALPGDTTPPTAPGDLRSTTVTHDSITLIWNPSTDNVGVVGYRVYRDGVLLGSTTETTYSNRNLQAQTSYTYTIRATDAAGNTSADSNSLRVSTIAAPDTTAPTAPQNVTSSNVGFTTATLSWGAATDNVGVKSYRVYRDGNRLSDTTNTTYTDSTLTGQKTYAYYVRAEDAAGNVSTESNTLTVTTPTPFGIISQSVATKTPSSATIEVKLTSAGNVQIQYGTSRTKLSSVKQSSPSAAQNGGTLHTIVLDGLKTGALYYYRVIATDAANTTNVVRTDGVSSFIVPTVTAFEIVSQEITNKTSTSAQLQVELSSAGHVRVNYGTTTNALTGTLLSNVRAGTDGKSHTLNFTSLVPNTQYFYRIVAVDFSNTENVIKTRTTSFITLADGVASSTSIQSATNAGAGVNTNN